MLKENIFNCREAFFVIDSDHLDQVQERLYGFAIVNDTLVQDCKALGNRDPKGNGAYVCVRRDSRQITIHQDYIGSYGLYLFRDQDYFALSNSFVALLDHIKQSYKITFNRDFANYMITSDLCSVSYAKTMVEEIEIVDRSAVVYIDAETKKLDIQCVDYGENTVELNSAEGMEILDTWYRKWTGLIRNLYKENNDIQIDLSGGFDTRMILTLFLGSGIDMNEVFVNSVHDDLHTHAEDYEIASAISEYYGFALNNRSKITGGGANYSIDDSINISFYLKLCFHKQMYPRICRFNRLRHYFGGSGGECVRSYWNTTQEEYIQKAVSRCKVLSSDIRGEFEQSTRNILTASFEGIQKKYEQFGRSIAPEDLTLNLYRETRCRNHFGKDIIENYYGGSVKYAPLLDPDLQKLKVNDKFCHDKNLLMAVIFDRYNSDLLNFKFDSKRSISARTIRYAKELNRRFPHIVSNDAQHTAIRKQTEKQIAHDTIKGNRAITLKDFREAIEGIFYSDRNRAMFELLYGEDLYTRISKDICTRKHQPLEAAYTVIGITKTLQDVLANENARCPSIADSFRSSVIESKSSFREKDTLLSDPYLENYIALRLDIKNTGAVWNDLEIVEISDVTAKMSKPGWLAHNGNGYTIESKKGKLELTIRCIHTGNLSVILRGRDVRDENKERIPFRIDLRSVSVNGSNKLDETRQIWYEDPFYLSRKVQAGETVRICLEWGPHKECLSGCVSKRMDNMENESLEENYLQKIKKLIKRVLMHFLRK